MKKCNNCGIELTHLVFTHPNMYEEWEFNGEKWECLGYTSLIANSELDVKCFECDAIVGKGKDFGF